ncbi:M3 family oligoendopeptidase [Salinicoccus roseus]|uniref:M3 family oligoendopeptidase n=1 Tax=Salinicoccus roseus TaxID=45670 RepID=UPI001CA76F46|nr:M3 family oligoendopeptidase [Salinicoccus roseus]MBY8910091.1 M3 family oligoendopeptidase [Salinicoccus roseus]
MALTFKDYKYERPDLDKISSEVDDLLNDFKTKTSAEEQGRVIDELNKHFNHLSTMSTLAYIRASIDTKDAFYDKERDFFDEYGPAIQEIDHKYYEAISSSPYKAALEERYGKQLFSLADNAIKGFDPKVKSLLQKENRLDSEYSKLLASAEIEFDGKVLNLSEFGPYAQHTDRSMRKGATEAVQGFMGEHLEKIDQIFDDLVKTRHEIARELGYKDFVELGYIRMNRIDYDRDMVENFRRQVAEHVVPLVTELKERQRRRIGLSELKSYDESFDFITGNAMPKGGTEEILKNGEKMYRELSPETDEFYKFMRERDLFDVEAKKGKEGGGYCTFIPEHESPFIFSNFNGTLDDVTVLTHEAGHAFQSYMSREFEVPEYQFPTLEAAEIHSMSMEYFTYPWMELFFKEDTDKFKFTHMADNISFLPYGVAIDEFQHIVYENPELTPEERRQEWKKLEDKYLPHRDYDGIEPLSSGSFWHRQGHVFGVPFYYIDYTLAQVCALQFWKRANEDFEAAWADYVELCKLGGSLPFNALARSANLISPFEDGCLESVVGEVKDYLNSIDDKSL